MKVFYIISVLLILLGIGWNTVPHKNTVVEIPVYPKTQVQAELQPLIRKLGINPYGLDIHYVDSYPIENQQANFDNIRTITLLRDAPNIEKELAHEYLHYIWNNKVLNKDELSNFLNELYNSDPGMQYRMKVYTKQNILPNTDQFTNELHSIYCTESSDAYLTQVIITECNKWINRNSLTFSR